MDKYARIQKALVDVRENNYSVRKAAKLNNIPRSTLQDRISGRVCENKKRSGPNPNLTDQEEKILTKWCLDLAKCGFPLKFEELSSSVKKILDGSNRVTSFKNNKPGRTWLNQFFKRNGLLSERESESISKGRAVVTEESIRKWFRDLGKYLEEIGHSDILNDSTRILNGDESGFQLCPKTGKVIAPRNASYVYQVQNGNEKENITVLFVISADGKYGPPLVVFPYVRVPQNLMSTVPPEWCVGRSESGWMKSDVFYEYVANGLDPWLTANNVKRPVILFVDGHSSHLNYELSEFCSNNGIILYALPPNTTHMMQPADVSLFKPLKTCWRQTVREWQSTHIGETLSRFTFCPLLERVLLTKEADNLSQTIKNGFRKCGLFPFDPNAVDYTKCVKNNTEKINAENNPPVTQNIVPNSKYEIAIEVIEELRQNLALNGIDPDIIVNIIKEKENPSIENIATQQNLINIDEMNIDEMNIDELPIIYGNDAELVNNIIFEDVVIEEVKPIVTHHKESSEAKDCPLVVQNTALSNITNHIYYPKPVEYKKKRNKTSFPSAISSKAWRDIHQQIEIQKTIKKESKPRGRPKRKVQDENSVPSKKQKID